MVTTRLDERSKHVYEYRIGYTTAEDHCNIELCHEQLFNKEELRQHLVRAVATACARYYKDHVDGKTEFFCQPTIEMLFGCEEFEQVLTEAGFSTITRKYAAECIVWGWADVPETDPPSGWDDYRHNDDALFDQLVRNELASLLNPDELTKRQQHFLAKAGLWSCHSVVKTK